MWCHLSGYRTTSFSATSYYLAHRIFVERTKREIVVISNLRFFIMRGIHSKIVKIPYYLGQSAPSISTPSPIVRAPSKRIVRPLNQYTPVNFLHAFWQVKIIYQCYSYFKSSFPCSKMPRKSRDRSILEVFLAKNVEKQI